MGTSTARRAPTTRAWRLTKVAATRYLSPESAAPAEAREVITRYVAALEEGSGQEAGGALAAFRLTRRIAQKLGEFCQQTKTSAGQSGLLPWGLADPASQTPMAAAHGQAAAWLEGTGGLEEAALRPVLVGLLSEIFQTFTQSPEGLPAPDPSGMVKKFLAAALYQRLVFDLGEPLEAAAAGWRPLSTALAGIHAEIAGAAVAGAKEASVPGDWQGLEGWLWVTRVLEEVLACFSSKNLANE